MGRAIMVMRPSGPERSGLARAIGLDVRDTVQAFLATGRGGGTTWPNAS